MERFSCGIFLFTLGFVVRTALGSFSSSSPDHCDGAISHISNGLCDEDTNNEACAWDGGDCCYCTCVSTPFAVCGRYGFDCLEPVGDATTSCDGQPSYSTLPSSAGDYYSEVVEGILAEFPDCMASTLARVGDGRCDTEVNVEECGWDAGDCCECSCVDGGEHECGVAGFECVDPDAGDATSNCGDMSASDVSPCAPDVSRTWVVEDTAKATALAEAMLCSGGRFEVEWRGHVFFDRTIHVLFGTELDVVGVGGTGATVGVADSAGVNRLFYLANGRLSVRNLQISNCAGTNGGAILAVKRSAIALRERVEFYNNTAETSGGAVYLDSNSSISWTGDTTFVENRAFYGGALRVGHNSSVVGAGHTLYSGNSAMLGGALDIAGSMATWSGDTVFVENSAHLGGGAVHVGDSVVAFRDTIFRSNSATHGGALFVKFSSRVSWEGGTWFSDNRASLDGGAISSALLTSAADEKGSSLLFVGDSTTFANNTCRAGGEHAGRGKGGAIALLGSMSAGSGMQRALFLGNSANSGGAIYMMDQQLGVEFMEVNFTANTALDGDGGAVFAAGCGTARTDDLHGGLEWNPTCFVGCHFDANSATSAGGAVYSTTGRDYIHETAFVGNTARAGGALRLAGTVVLSDSSFSDNAADEGEGPAVSNVGTAEEMTGCSFSGNGLRCPASSFLDFTEGNSSRLQTVCEGCNMCRGCSIESNSSIPICTAVFEHANSGGGHATLENLIVDPGHWRASNTSREILACFNEDACLGGVTGDPSFCREGYEGPYCSVCSEGYGGTLVSTCRKCSGGDMVAAVVAAGAFSLVGLVLVWYMVSIEKEGTRGGVIDRVQALLPLQSCKIVIVVWQIVTQFSSVANVTYPETFRRFLDIIAVVNFDLGSMLSSVCIMGVDFLDGMALATIGPIAAIALLGVTYGAAVHRNGSSQAGLRKVRRKHCGMVIFVTFLVYSSVSSAVFRAFVCDKLDDGNEYLRSDYRIVCNSPRHKGFQLYAGVMIVLYPIGIPLFYVFLLLQKRTLLANDAGCGGRGQQQPFSSLWKPYRPSAFYYEVVECGRRILLTGVVVFMYPDTATQIALTLVITFMFVVVSEGMCPYASRWERWVFRAGNVIVFVSVYIALLIKVDMFAESDRNRSILAGALLAVHALMILLVIAEAVTRLTSSKCGFSQFHSSRDSKSISAVAPFDSPHEDTTAGVWA